MVLTGKALSNWIRTTKSGLSAVEAVLATKKLLLNWTPAPFARTTDDKSCGTVPQAGAAMVGVALGVAVKVGATVAVMEADGVAETVVVREGLGVGLALGHST